LNNSNDDSKLKNLNNSGKFIDFNKELKVIKELTELNIPYTITQVEDAMYLDQNFVVTLEYHFYQKDLKYSYIKARKEFLLQDGTLMDNNGEVTNLLATEKF
jgi:hypothetical protein